MANLIGQTLGQYEVTALVGEGGMATVYMARQASIKRNVAIKVIESKLARNPEFVKRFEREAETVASLSHSHILKVFDYGRQDDLIYLVMELLTGGSLADLISRGPLPPETANRLFDQIASALDYAHRRGIIHRDLKPQNVLLDDNGDAHLTDFGIAKILTETTALTMSGVAIGTPAYMAPEQWQGEALDARADIYSLGVMLFEMLTGQLPFKADTPASMMYAHLNAPPPTPDLSLALPPGVGTVIQKALAKDRDKRFSSAGELASALKSALAAPVPAAPLRETVPPTVYEIPLPPPTPGAVINPTIQPKRQMSPVLGVVGGAVIVVLIGAILYLLTYTYDRNSIPSTPTAVVALVASPTAAIANITSTWTPDPTTVPTLEQTATALPVVALTIAPTVTPMPPTDPFTPDPTSTFTASPIPFTSTTTFTATPTNTIVPTLVPVLPTLTPTLTYTATPSPVPTTQSFASNLTGWKTVHPGGTWVNMDSGLVADISTGSDSYYVADSNVTDFTYEASFTMTGGTDLAAAGVVFRSNPDPLKGSYLARVSIFNGGEIALVKFFPVKQYKQLALKNLPINLNTSYTIKIVGKGQQISVYLNGAQVLQANDSDYLQGTVGLNIFGSSTIYHQANVTAGSQ